MGCGNKLISPKLQDGQQLNGQLILKVFRSKSLYVRPSETLLVSYWIVIFCIFYVSVVLSMDTAILKFIFYVLSCKLIIASKTLELFSIEDPWLLH